VILVSPSFHQWSAIPSWLPKEAQGQIIKQRWNDFVSQSENMLTIDFRCKNYFSGAKICIKRLPT
jgi:hypothetical protein